MPTLEEIKQCKSYADAIKLILGKNYTNGRTQDEVKEWCFSNYNFDLEKHLEDYKNRKVYCLQCGKELTGRNRFTKKFCNNSCAAKYNNKGRIISDTQKEKTSKSLRERYAKLNNTTIEERYFNSVKPDEKPKLKYKHICVVCGNEFYSTHKHSTHCSPKCIGEDPNIKQKLRDKVQERKDNGTFSGWQSRNITSYPEKFWINVLDNNEISYIREDFSTKKYFLDFVIEKDGKKIDLEIDGKQHKYEDRKQHDKERDEYLQNLGYIVYRIEWNSINNEKGKNLMKSKIENFLDFYDNL